MRAKRILIGIVLTIVSLLALGEPPFAVESRIMENDYGEVFAIIDINIGKTPNVDYKTISVHWQANLYQFFDYTGTGEVKAGEDKLAIFISGEDNLHCLRFRMRNSGSSEALFHTALMYSNPIASPNSPNIIAFKKEIEVKGIASNDSNHGRPYRLNIACSPNPFNASLKIDYTIPYENEIDIAIYDILGRELITLVKGVRSQGFHSIIWDSEDASGNRAPSGIYFVKFIFDEEALVKRIQLLK
jgi:hypothetical protein